MLAQSVTILHEDTADMKMEPLLQIQENVGKILESYEKMFGERLKKTSTSLMTYLTLQSGSNQRIQNNCWTTNLAFWNGEI